MEQPVITSANTAFQAWKQYAIPSYQRNYVWTKHEHWQPLWEDVKELARRVVESDNLNKARPHFLGTIITKLVGTENFTNRWWVVDGQQRLTTLQVLIAATYAAFVEKGLSQAAILADLLTNAPDDQDKYRTQRNRYKVAHKSDLEYDQFRGVIEHALAGKTGNADSSDLHECYAFFLDTLRRWLNDLDASDLDASVAALTNAILHKLQVVDIRLDDQENSHTIFETLNARGAPLTEWEKTKNYILSIVVDDEDPYGDEFYREHLERYDADPFWNESVTGPRFHGKRIDWYLFFFAQLELPRLRFRLTGDRSQRLPRNQLYREFRFVGERIYRRDQEKRLAMIRRFARYADICSELSTASLESFTGDAQTVIRRVWVLNLQSLIPVLMELIRKLGNGPELGPALRVIDSYLMRRVALRAYYSGFDDVAFAHVQAIREAPADEIVSVLIDRFSNSSPFWPDDQEVHNQFANADMYNRFAKWRLRMLLAAIAKRMHEEHPYTTEGDFTIGQATIEHVAPQSWEAHWKEDLRFDGSADARIRINQLVHRIGNLTLVGYNPNLGNRRWSEKRELLAKDRFEMNRRLLQDMNGDSWNEAEIDRRGKELAEYVVKIWPNADTLRRELVPDLVDGQE